MNVVAALCLLVLADAQREASAENDAAVAALCVADVARRLSAYRLTRDIDDGTIWSALQRLVDRRCARYSVRPVDGRGRLRFFSITADGSQALSEFAADARAIVEAVK